MCLAVLGALAMAGTVVGEPWWWDFEFDDPNDLPPSQGDGWLRRYQPAPFGVVHDGVLTYDSNDPQTYDFWEYSRPGALDPGPGEVFVCEWRLHTEWVSYYGDPRVSVKSDDAWVVSLSFDVDTIHSEHEYVDIPIPPGDWHNYGLLSENMRTYELYIDGALAREGAFAHRYATSQVQWGDQWQGVASSHDWAWFRVGTLQAPLSGDTNCDGCVDFGDINPFVLALTDQADYQDSYPGCWPSNADVNGDGSVDFGDINPFVALLTK
jgi:hypothetical protein